MILWKSVIILPKVTPVPVTVSSVELPLITENCVGVTEAVTLPVAICERLSPTIAVDGIFDKFAPLPEKLPVIPAVTNNDPVI